MSQTKAQLISGTSTQDVTFDDATVSSLNGGPIAGARNRIINGDMRIDQRNAGAAITVNNFATYTVDRWIVEDGSDAVLSVQQTTDAPSGQGFTNSLQVTATTADTSIGSTQYVVIAQSIEGFNTADLNFGNSSAVSVTASFWVKATVAGQYSCTIYNNGASRINPQSFVINSSNTWERKTITFVGDTAGTWLTNNGRGIVLNIYLALGSTYLGAAGWNGSNIYGVTGQANAVANTNNIFAITGVQLEAGSVATPFERRSYGQEWQLCLRYFETSYPTGTAIGAVGHRAFPSMNYSKGANTTGECGTFYPFTVEKRAVPDIAFWDGNGTASKCSRLDPGVSWNDNQTATVNGAYRNSWMLLSGSGSTGSAAFANWTASAEL